MAALILVLSTLFAGAALYQDPGADRLIRSATNATYMLRLGEARDAARELQRKYPDHPAGFLIETETYWWEAQEDPGNIEIEKAFYRLHDVAQAKGEAALQTTKYYRPELLAYLASIYGSYGRFEVTQKESYLTALRAGLKAYDYAQQVYALDKEYYDIYVGLGAFNYFVGTLPPMIKPFALLIGVSGDPNLGITQLQTAMQKARYSQTEARIVYYSALVSNKQYASAFPLLQGLISDYPDNFVFYDWMADWFREQKKTAEAIAYFDTRHQEQIKHSALMAQYALLEKADAQALAGLKSDALQSLQAIRAISRSDALILKKADALQKEIEKR
jgi:hypothetical protein